MKDGEELKLRVFGDQALFADMPFLAIFDRKQDCAADGMRVRPALLFRVSYDARWDATTIIPTDWDEAAMMAPVALGQFACKLDKARRGE